ncbi:unnamed protein product [Mytilus edulis]|uniref:Uncharacterized protein n=1 Tax=Mytilus edulis TaxID=6550 RepID=A0A8S3S9F4_MYTED|nr:unnamed protein product [Mytilus edulis]
MAEVHPDETYTSSIYHKEDGDKQPSLTLLDNQHFAKPELYSEGDQPPPYTSVEQICVVTDTSQTYTNVPVLVKQPTSLDSFFPYEPKYQKISATKVTQSSNYSQIPLTDHVVTDISPTYNSGSVNEYQPTSSTSDHVDLCVSENQTVKISSRKKAFEYVSFYGLSLLRFEGFLFSSTYSIDLDQTASKARDRGDVIAARRLNKMAYTLIRFSIGFGSICLIVSLYTILFSMI